MPQWLTTIRESIKDEEKLKAFDLVMEGIDLQKLFDPILDSAVSKGVETNKKKLEADFSAKYETYYEEKLTKEHPELKPSAEMKRIKELEEKLISSEKKERREAIKAQIAASVKLPDFVDIDSFISEDVDSSLSKAKQFTERFAAHETAIAERIKTETASKYNVIPKGGGASAPVQEAAAEQARNGDVSGALRNILTQQKKQ